MLNLRSMPLFTLFTPLPSTPLLTTLPPELLLLIAENLPPGTLTSLILVNRHLSYLLTPLLTKYAQRHWHDPDGYPAILRAAITGHSGLARMALETRPGAKKNTTTTTTTNLEKRCHRGETALHHAARRGDLAIVRLLLDNGARVNAVEDNFGNTALHIAAAGGHEAVVRCLLKRGANIDFQNLDGKPPIVGAVKKAQAGTVEVLLGEGATVPGRDAHGDTVLHWAAEYGGVELVAALMRERWRDGEKWGVEVDARNNSEWTPLHYAAQRTRDAADVARVLMEGGADVNAVDPYGRTPLHFALTELLREYRYKRSCAANRREREAIVGFLLERNACFGEEAVGLLTSCKERAGRFNKFRGTLSQALKYVKMRARKIDA